VPELVAPDGGRLKSELEPEPLVVLVPLAPALLDRAASVACAAVTVRIPVADPAASTRPRVAARARLRMRFRCCVMSPRVARPGSAVSQATLKSTSNRSVRSLRVPGSGLAQSEPDNRPPAAGARLPDHLEVTPRGPRAGTGDVQAQPGGAAVAASATDRVG
jgi:hypothetical protein